MPYGSLGDLFSGRRHCFVDSQELYFSRWYCGGKYMHIVRVSNRGVLYSVTVSKYILCLMLGAHPACILLVRIFVCPWLIFLLFGSIVFHPPRHKRMFLFFSVVFLHDILCSLYMTVSHRIVIRCCSYRGGTREIHIKAMGAGQGEEGLLIREGRFLTKKILEKKDK